MTHATFILLALFVLTCPTWAGADDRPEIPPPPPQDGPKVEGRPNFGGPHRGPMRDGGFDNLPEADKQRVREAMDKAWKKPEMQVAKDKFMKASEEFRNNLRETLQGIDPEVVKILDKVKPPMPWEKRGPPPPPKPEEPDFARRSVARLGFEFMAFGKPEQRDALRKLHERVLLLEPVKAALAELEAAPVEKRMDAFKTLREAYKKEVEREIAEFRQKRQPPRPENANKSPQ